MPLTLALVIFELAVMVLSICLHDSAQAWMANRLGDPTGRMMGRISINPQKHFDWFGMVIWPILFIFQSPLVLGWGKPVPMTSRNFRRPSRDEMLATLAGPGMQLLAAIIALIILMIMRRVQHDSMLSLVAASQLGRRNVVVPLNELPAIFPLYLFLYFCILVNVLLFVFNLIPLPFLDGGKILMHYLPYNAAKTYQSLSMWMMIAFFFLGYAVIVMFFNPLMAIFNGLLL